MLCRNFLSCSLLWWSDITYLGTLASNGPIIHPQMVDKWIKSNAGMILTGENRYYRRNICPSINVSTTNATKCPQLGSGCLQQNTGRQLTAIATTRMTHTFLRPFCNLRWLWELQHQWIKTALETTDQWGNYITREALIKSCRSWEHSYRQRRNLPGWRRLGSELYSGDVGFASRSKQRLYWLRWSGVFLKPPSKGSDSTLN